MTVMATEQPLLDCRCGHPAAAHSDRAFVACTGQVEPAGEFRKPSCGCSGYTPKAAS